MAGRHVVDEDFAEAQQVLGVGRGSLGFITEGAIGIDQFMAFLQPAVDQLVYSTPSFLGVLAALEHDVLTSLLVNAGVLQPRAGYMASWAISHNNST
ncbi:hypothetical protein D3C78_1736840 [compost metagenome]